MKRRIFVPLRSQLPGTNLAVMAENAVQNLESEIQAQAFVFHMVKKLNGLYIMLKGGQSMTPTDLREDAFAFMTKRRMTDVMAERDRLDQILVEPEKAADGSSNTRDNLHMQDPVRDMIVVNQRENLGFIDITGISLGMEDAVGIMGKGLPVIRQGFAGSANGVTARAGE